MKKLFLLLLSLEIMILLLTSCDSGQTNNIDEISFVDVLTSYDDESIYIPDKNDNSNTTETVITENGFLSKGKLYDYQDHNVMVLYLENQTDKNYNISINVDYIDSNGNTIKQESKSFVGFASGFINYFVFNPNIAFSDYKYKIEFDEYTGTAYSKYVKTNNSVNLELVKNKKDPSNASNSPWVVSICADYQMINTSTEYLYFSGDFILFDNAGNLYMIDDALQSSMISPDNGNTNASESYIKREVLITDHLWSEKNTYKWPAELNSEGTGNTSNDNLIGFIAFKAISDKPLFEY